MTKLVYVAGIGHSGSTLLDVMLNHADGVCSLDGASGVFNAVRKGSVCSCGETVPECELWGPILDRLTDEERERLWRYSRMVLRERNLHRFALPTAVSRDYAALNDRIFDAAFELTGDPVLVDSSKNISRAASLLRYSRQEIWVLHLIRDPRGYVNGRNKDLRKWGRPTPRMLDPLARWTFKNAAASALRRAIRGRYMKVTFEDLLLEPKAVLRSIGDFLDHDLSRSLVPLEEGNPYQGYHVTSGNPQVRKHRGEWGKVWHDPSFIGRNELKELDADLFWYLGGWVSVLWGYDRAQSYLDGRVPRRAHGG